jgi:hypothetical protein
VGDDWRVCLIFDGRAGGRRKPRYPAAVLGSLRSHLGSGVTVSAGNTCIFVYAATADAAAEAEQAALWVLAQQNLNAGSRIEGWDAASQTWRDTRTEPPGAGPRRRHRRSGVAGLIESLIDIVPWP